MNTTKLDDMEVLLPPLPGEVRGWGRLKRIVAKFPTANLEILGGLAFLMVGIWFCLPANDYPTSGVLRSIYDGKTWLWGPAFLLLGVYKFWVVLWHYETRHRFIVAFVALVMVWQVFLAYVEVSPEHWGVVVSVLAMIHQVWLIARNRQTWNR